MSDYLVGTQTRMSNTMEDKAVLMCAYVRLDLDPKLLRDNNQHIQMQCDMIKDLAASASESIHKAVETEIQTREGSIIIEAMLAGNLYELLKLETLASNGFEMTREDLVNVGGRLLLDYIMLRSTLLALLKDIKGTASSLTWITRWVFKATRKHVLRSEARTGVIGYFLRGLEAIDVVRAEGNSFEKRAGAMKRASHHFYNINKSVGNVEDRQLLCAYLTREMKRIKEITAKADSEKKQKHIDEYNVSYRELLGIKEDLCI